MRTFLSTLLVCFSCHALSAQQTATSTSKPSIDTGDILNWPLIPNWPPPVISNNGEYLLYSIWHIPPGGTSMIIRAVREGWEIALTEAQQASFTDDSRRLVFITPNDSLCILTLINHRREYEPNVSSFKLFMHKGREMLAYQRTNREKELVLYELSLGIKHVYENIDNYIINTDGQHMLLQTMLDSNRMSTLLYLNLTTKELKNIWKGFNLSSLSFDKSGKQLAFLARDSITKDTTLYLYKTGHENVMELMKAVSPDLPRSMKIAAVDNFNKDGTKLFLRIKEQSQRHFESSFSPITIWSYRDPKLQTQQADENSGSASSYLAVLNVQSPHHLWRIQQQNEIVTANNLNGLVILTSRDGNITEKYWSKAASSNTVLVWVDEEKRISIPLTRPTFSPGQKYLLGNGISDIWGSDLYVYDVTTGAVRNITKGIPAMALRKGNDITETSSGKGLILAAWLPADTGLLIYDDYDIWQIEPTGKKKPINLTNGREKEIQFRLAEDALKFPKKAIQPGEQLILVAFNTKTKQNGFYQLKWATGQAPKPLLMGDYFFSKMATNSYILKVRDRNTYVVKREQANCAPNIFSTVNFRTFSQMTYLHPEKVINWYTSELIDFTTVNGTETQAILYKPENFNTTNKYPLLIHYYDKISDELNRYRPPEGWGTGGDLDVAWFASHGYLVLLTDINFNIGKPGESIYKAIAAAAKHISKRPYTDKAHIGVQGHSFGGYETNYLITRSNLFAAAVSSAGISNTIAFYGGLWPDGSSVQEYFERRGFRIPNPPWQTAKVYTENAPIFSIANVNTPMLLVHNKSDRNVYFEQGLEFFTALRRAGKRVWMLQYKNADHGQAGEEYKDYLIRTSQFFNHYLKGTAPPEWMTQGLPAAMKGINDGLGIDKAMATPGTSF